MKIREFNEPTDTHSNGMAQNQLLKIGQHAIKIENMIGNSAETNPWVAKKIDLVSNYVKSVHDHTAGSEAGTYDDEGMSEDGMTSADVDRINKQKYSDKEVRMAKGVAFDKRNKDNMSKATSTIEKVRKGLSQQPDVADALKTANEDAGVRDWSTDKVKEFGDDLIKLAKGQVPSNFLNIDDLEDGWAGADQDSQDQMAETIGGSLISVLIGYLQFSAGQKPSAEDVKDAQGVVNAPAFKKAYHSTESVSEDAGTSPLKETAKMAIELIELLNNGGSIDEATQNILNQAADNLQAVYHYEDYQKQNPYSEEIDSALVQKHSQLVQAGLEGILAHNTKVEDVDTKPGMMRILKKRVNEVEKEIAKENRTETSEDIDSSNSTSILTKAGVGPKAIQKYIDVFNDHGDTTDLEELNKLKVGLADLMSMVLKSHNIENESVDEGGMPSSIIKHKQKLAHMSDEELADRFKGYDEKKLRQMAWSHGYGNMSSHYLDRVKNVMTSKRTGTTEAELEEGIKDWAKNLAMAGVIVAGLAGVNSVNDAIDRSVPAVQAIETALELAQDQGNDELAKAIEKDLSGVKVRLSSGKDLNFVKDMQEKYSKFVKTEGLAYESKLQVQLNQQLK